MTALARPGLTAVEHLGAARQALAQARSVREVKDVRDKLAAIEQYTRQAGLGLEAQNECAELRLWSERKAGELLDETVRDPQNGRRPEVSRDATLPELGISRSQSSRWQRLAAVGERDFAAHLTTERECGRELTTAGVLRTFKVAGRPAPPRPEPAVGSYEVLYVDPPWRYEHNATPADRGVENHYPTMTADELAALPVPAADDAVLFCWATNPKLEEALRLLSAWGFAYRTQMVWVKDRIGMGYWVRGQHEPLLIATRGHVPAPAPADRPPSVIHAPRGEHSAKPAEVYELVERMCPDRTRVELFARHARPGWDAWGNEAPAGEAA